MGGRKIGELDFGDDATFNVGEWQFKWFEYWLKGRETGVQDWPAYYLFVMGENRWRGENEWPLKRTQFTSYYLHSDGKANSLKGDGSLNTTAPSQEKPDEFAYDGDNPVPTVGGNNLVGAAAGPYDQTKVEERDGCAGLFDRAAGAGRRSHRAGEVDSARRFERARHGFHRQAGGRASGRQGFQPVRWHPPRALPEQDLAKEALLEPGKAEQFEIDLWVTSNLFKRGHRIRLEVSSSNFPRFDRNPNSGKPFGTDTELLSAKQTIFHDAEHPSQLVLPVIPR